MKGKTVWQLHLKETDGYKFYSSFRALFNDNTVLLGKSRSYFEKLSFETPLSNENYSILKSEMHTTGQVDKFNVK